MQTHILAVTSKHCNLMKLDRWKIRYVKDCRM